MKLEVRRQKSEEMKKRMMEVWNVQRPTFEFNFVSSVVKKNILKSIFV